MPEDFRVAVSFRTSRKRRRLMRLLDSHGVVALLDLWSYAAMERPDGDLSGLSDDDIADEVAWMESPNKLVGALLTCGFLEGEPGAYKLHNWAARQPWVATSPARSKAGKKAVHERHAKRGNCKGGTEWCDERCTLGSAENDKCPNESTERTQSYESVLRNSTAVEKRTTPIPNPIPNPNPIPDPSVRTAERGDYDEVPLPEVEAEVVSAGLIGVGQGATGMGKLSSLHPILAWELREGMAIAKAAGAKKGVSYLAAVITGMRRDGRKPSPKASPPKQAKPQLSRAELIAQIDAEQALMLGGGG